MVTLIFSRLRQGVVVLWAALTITFFLGRVVGDPIALILGESGTREEIQAIRESLGLARPLYVQYFDFFADALRGDLGTSVWTGRPVTEEIIRAIPKTLELAVVTIIVVLAVSVPLGMWAGSRPRSPASRATTFLSFTAVSLPEFWFGLVLIIVFAVELGLLPTSGYGSWRFFVLPVATLMIRSSGRIARTTQRSVRRVLAQDFILTAEAQGFSRKRILFRHALPNALLGVLTIAGDEFAHLVSGAVIVETIFSWPGLGNLSILAIRQRDPFLLLGIVIVIGAFILLVNLIVDLLYAAVDPRVRAGWTGAKR